MHIPSHNTLIHHRVNVWLVHIVNTEKEQTLKQITSC